MPINWPSAVIFSTLTAWMGWLLFKALKTGVLQVLIGTKSPLATRAGTPKIFWGVIVLNVVILLRFAASALQAWGLPMSI